MFYLKVGVQLDSHAVRGETVTKIHILHRSLSFIKSARSDKEVASNGGASAKESRRSLSRVLMKIMMRQILELADETSVHRLVVVRTDYRFEPRLLDSGADTPPCVSAPGYVRVPKKK